MRVLLVQPYVGEIGWELMSWQGHVRATFQQGQYDRLVVVGSAGKAAFYADMPLDYHDIDLSDAPGRACDDRRHLPDSDTYVDADTIREHVAPLVGPIVARYQNNGHAVEVLSPSYSGEIIPCDARHQTLIQYKETANAAPNAPWVVLAIRSRGAGAMNWSADDWSYLADRLNAQGIHTTAYPNESQAAIRALSHCDLAVGQSTGGLHLASLCNCPHVVWSTDDSHLWTPMLFTNRQRYETVWNPLATPVEYHGHDHLPSIEQAERWIVAALKRIGRRTGSRLHRARFRSTWQVRTSLYQAINHKPLQRRIPWRLDQAIRYKLV